MNWLTLVLLLIFVVALIQGFQNGFIKSLITFVALVAGLWLALRFYPQLGAWLQTFVSSEAASKVIAFIIILVGVLIAASIVASIVTSAVSAIGLGCFNRLAGAFLNVLVAAVVISGILAVLVQFPVSESLQKTIRESMIAQFLLSRFPVALYIMPYFDRIKDFFQQPAY